MKTVLEKFYELMIRRYVFPFVSVVQYKCYYSWAYAYMFVYTLVSGVASFFVMVSALCSKTGVWMELPNGSTLGLLYRCDGLSECHSHGLDWMSSMSDIISTAATSILVGVVFQIMYICREDTFTLVSSFLCYAYTVTIYCCLGVQFLVDAYRRIDGTFKIGFAPFCIQCSLLMLFVATTNIVTLWKIKHRMQFSLGLHKLLDRAIAAEKQRYQVLDYLKIGCHTKRKVAFNKSCLNSERILNERGTLKEQYNHSTSKERNSSKMQDVHYANENFKKKEVHIFGKVQASSKEKNEPEALNEKAVLKKHDDHHHEEGQVALKKQDDHDDPKGNEYSREQEVHVVLKVQENPKEQGGPASVKKQQNYDDYGKGQETPTVQDDNAAVKKKVGPATEQYSQEELTSQDERMSQDETLMNLSLRSSETSEKKNKRKKMKARSSSARARIGT